MSKAKSAAAQAQLGGRSVPVPSAEFDDRFPNKALQVHINAARSSIETRHAFAKTVVENAHAVRGLDIGAVYGNDGAKDPNVGCDVADILFSLLASNYATISINAWASRSRQSAAFRRRMFDWLLSHAAEGLIAALDEQLALAAVASMEDLIFDGLPVREFEGMRALQLKIRDEIIAESRKRITKQVRGFGGRPRGKANDGQTERDKEHAAKAEKRVSDFDHHMAEQKRAIDQQREGKVQKGASEKVSRTAACRYAAELNECAISTVRRDVKERDAQRATKKKS